VSDLVRRLAALLEEVGATPKFGLRQQGHVPTVERMLAAGATWPEIGRAIGWSAKAAQEWYERFERNCDLR
jgi:hypothetical protein